MARLKFDLHPISREDHPWQNREEHEAYVRKVWATWERDGEPAPCDCGYFGDGWLVMCDARDRARCKADAPKRLESYYRHQHLKGLAEKRKFPEQPPAGKGMCRWCRQPIVHGKVGQRTAHDGRKDEPNCKLTYRLHTELGAQQAHLEGRDGPGCFSCGTVKGRWQLVWLCQEHRVDEYGYAGPCSVIQWSTWLEVDHLIALAVAFECFPDPDRRRWFFGPRNLRLLCNACHAAKTREDMALLRAVRLHGPEWGRAEVIDRLARAGLLQGATPKGAT